MEALIIALNPLDRIFAIFAIVGGLMFLFRVVMNLFGGDNDGGGDADVDGDDLSHDGDMGDTDSSFRLLTIQGLTGFFLVFGLAGLAMHRSSKAGEVMSILVAFALGVVMMAVMAKLTSMMRQLQSSGNIDTRRAIGQTGMTYMRIPEGGTGKVQVAIQDRLKTMDAMAEDKALIETGQRVEVVDVINQNLLIVKLY